MIRHVINDKNIFSPFRAHIKCMQPSLREVLCERPQFFLIALRRNDAKLAARNIRQARMLLPSHYNLFYCIFHAKPAKLAKAVCDHLCELRGLSVNSKNIIHNYLPCELQKYFIKCKEKNGRIALRCSSFLVNRVIAFRCCERFGKNIPQ